jgi:hypothetical protein
VEPRRDLRKHPRRPLKSVLARDQRNNQVELVKDQRKDQRSALARDQRKDPKNIKFIKII